MNAPITKFGRFLVAGGLNSALTYGLYLLLLPVAHYEMSYATAYVVGIGVSYLLNSRYVFNVVPTKRTMISFPLVYLLQYAYGAVALMAFIGGFGLDKKVALLIVMATSMGLTFLLLRLIFERRSATP